MYFNHPHQYDEPRGMYTFHNRFQKDKTTLTFYLEWHIRGTLLEPSRGFSIVIRRVFTVSVIIKQIPLYHPLTPTRIHGYFGLIPTQAIPPASHPRMIPPWVPPSPRLCTVFGSFVIPNWRLFSHMCRFNGDVLPVGTQEQRPLGPRESKSPWPSRISLPPLNPPAAWISFTLEPRRRESHRAAAVNSSPRSLAIKS